MPPSEATSQYPPVAGSAAIPTMGLFSVRLPVEPQNPASPNVKTPPSEATSQNPPPLGVAAIPTIGWLGTMLSDPRPGASPHDTTCPVLLAIQ